MSLKKIYEYQINISKDLDMEDCFVITTPGIPDILKIGILYNHVIKVWAMVDLEADNYLTKIRVLGTGATVHEGDEYLGTAYDPDVEMVWHVFKCKEQAAEGGEEEA